MDKKLIEKIEIKKCINFGVNDVCKLFLEIEALLLDGWMVLVGDKSGLNKFVSHYIANFFPDHLKFYKIKADKIKANLEIILAKKNSWYRDQLTTYGFDPEGIETTYMILFKPNNRLEATYSDNPFKIRKHITQMIIEFLLSMKIGRAFIDECFKKEF